MPASRLCGTCEPIESQQCALAQQRTRLWVPAPTHRPVPPTTPQADKLERQGGDTALVNALRAKDPTVRVKGILSRPCWSCVPRRGMASARAKTQRLSPPAAQALRKRHLMTLCREWRYKCAISICSFSEKMDTEPSPQYPAPLQKRPFVQSDTAACCFCVRSMFCSAGNLLLTSPRLRRLPCPPSHRCSLWVHKRALDSEKTDPDGHDQLMECIDAKDVLNHEAFGRTVTVRCVSQTGPRCRRPSKCAGLSLCP